MLSRDFGYQLQDLLEAGADLDDALAEIRASGATIVESIKAVRAAQGLGISEAKRCVEESAVWSDFRAEQEGLHEELERLGLESDTDNK